VQIEHLLAPLLAADFSKTINSDAIVHTLAHTVSGGFELPAQLEEARAKIESTMQAALATLSTMEISNIDPSTVLAFVGTLSNEQKMALMDKFQEIMHVFESNLEKALQSKDLLLDVITKAQSAIKRQLHLISSSLTQEQKAALDQYTKPLTQMDLKSLSAQATDVVTMLANQASELSKSNPEEAIQKLAELVKMAQSL
jgi:hypothetical protein